MGIQLYLQMLAPQFMMKKSQLRPAEIISLVAGRFDQDLADHGRLVEEHFTEDPAMDFSGESRKWNHYGLKAHSLF